MIKLEFTVFQKLLQEFETLICFTSDATYINTEIVIVNYLKRGYLYY